MKRKMSLFVLLSFLIGLLLWPSPADAQTWARSYGGSRDDFYARGEPTADGGFIVSAHSASFKAAWISDRTIWIFKLGPRGEVEWQNAYNPQFGPSLFSAAPWAIHQTRDLGYIMSGVLCPAWNECNILVLRLNEDGSVRWAKSYGTPVRQEGQDNRANIVELPDGGFVLHGGAYHGYDNSEILVLRLDPAGNLLWQKWYGASYASQPADSAYDIQYTSDGGFIVAGFKRFPDASEADFLTFKLDAAGTILWQKAFRVPGRAETPYAGIRETPDGGFVAAGTSWTSSGSPPAEGWMLRLDAMGNMIWQKKYWGPGPVGISGEIQLVRDGGFAVLMAGALAKLNVWGDIEWAKRMSWGRGPYWLGQLASGEFVLTGDRVAADSAGIDAMVLKVDGNGQIGPDCPLSLPDPELYSGPWNAAVADPGLFSGFYPHTEPYPLVPSSVSIAVNPTNATVMEFCTGGAANSAPEANAGADQQVSCASATGTQVTLDGSASSDPDGDTLTFTWTGPFPEGGGSVTGLSPTVTLPLGVSTITLTVDDGNGGTSTDTVEFRVNVSVEGLLSPLAALAPEDSGLVPLPGKAFKQGSTLPLKLRMTCGATALTAADVAPPRIVALTLFDDPILLTTIDPDAGEANDNGLLFRYSEPNWIYNLSSRDLATGTYILVIELPDGRRFAASFVLR